MVENEATLQSKKGFLYKLNLRFWCNSRTNKIGAGDLRERLPHYFALSSARAIRMMR
jgi:hypothetical protein